MVTTFFLLKRKVFFIILSLGMIGVLFLAWIPSTSAASIVVDTTDSGVNYGNGECSLEEAIDNANQGVDLTLGDCISGTTGLDHITFAISGAGPFVIQPTASLSIFDPVVIDGTTQTGSSCSTQTLMISLDFSLVTGAHGIHFIAGSLGSSIQGLNIYGTDVAQAGILISDSDGTRVTCSNIGTNYDATALAPNFNQGPGIQIINSDSVIIGGSTSVDRNIISGNLCEGIVVYDGDNIFIQGNYIGTSADGRTSLGNGEEGIDVYGSANIADLTVGGNSIGEGNIISGNGFHANGLACSVPLASTYDGVRISSPIFGNSFIDTIIAGNIIGLSSSGASMPNARYGLYLGDGAQNTTIGSLSTNGRNIIASNGSNFGDPNVYLFETVDTTVMGNYIGTDISGVSSRGGDIGILIVNTTGTTLTSNVITGNDVYGIAVRRLNSGSVPINTTIQTNTIGVFTDQTVIGNGTANIVLFEESDNTLIGGTHTTEANIISGGSYGILIFDTPLSVPNDVAILGNSIFGHSILGIDLATDSNSDFTPDISTGVTSNDAGDSDTGPNDFLNFPVLDTVSFGGGQIVIDYTADLPAGSYRIEFFENTNAASSGYGEGETFLFSDTFTHSGSGSQGFSSNESLSSLPTHIVAIVTEIIGPGNFGASSEFSAIYTNPVVTLSPSSPSSSGGGVSRPRNILDRIPEEEKVISEEPPEDDCFPFIQSLYFGSRDGKNGINEVARLQTKLKEYGFFSASIDGIFGIKTAKALGAWQQQNKEQVLAPWGMRKPALPFAIFYTTSQYKMNRDNGCPAKKTILENGFVIEY